MQFQDRLLAPKDEQVREIAFLRIDNNIGFAMALNFIVWFWSNDTLKKTFRRPISRGAGQ
jgi:hypothetical protein